LNIPVSVGEKLYIVLMDRNSKEKAMLVSQVMEELGDGLFVIAMPMIGGELEPIQIGKEVALVYYRENGVFEFRAKVIGRSEEKLPSLSIQALTPVKKSQRRNYYRLNTVLSVLIYYITPPENVSVQSFKCFIIDISAGGMRLASTVDIKKDSIILCKLELMDKPLSIKAKVIRNTAVNNQKYDYEIGTQFLDLDEKIRGEIIGFIFEKQRKLKRKGLI